MLPSSSEGFHVTKRTKDQVSEIRRSQSNQGDPSSNSKFFVVGFSAQIQASAFGLEVSARIVQSVRIELFRAKGEKSRKRLESRGNRNDTVYSRTGSGR